MDLTFNYLDGSTSLFEANETSTVNDVHKHVTDSKDYMPHVFSLSYKGEELCRMDTPIEEIIEDVYDIHVRLGCCDTSCIMSLRDREEDRIIYFQQVMDCVKYSHVRHPKCIEYLTNNPFNFKKIMWAFISSTKTIVFPVITQEMYNVAVEYNPLCIKDVPYRFIYTGDV